MTIEDAHPQTPNQHQRGSLLLTMAAASRAVAHISMASANLTFANSSPNLFLMYRKFNMDGLNDYCQMVIKTSHHKQHEILLMMAYIGRPEGWETMSNPIHIPIALSADFIERIQLACNTKLPPACKDKVHPKACLFNTTLDKARLIIDICNKNILHTFE